MFKVLIEPSRSNWITVYGVDGGLLLKSKKLRNI